jgi:hypothetical protein
MVLRGISRKLTNFNSGGGAFGLTVVVVATVLQQSVTAQSKEWRNSPFN